jgi:cell division protein FtsB
MIIIHKTNKNLRARVADLDDKGGLPSSYRRVYLTEAKRKPYIVVDHTGYLLVRGKSDFVRVLPEEQEKRWREIQAEIERLKKERDDVIEEGWVRADPYVHKEEKEKIDG